jgi:hypothetical protein
MRCLSAREAAGYRPLESSGVDDDSFELAENDPALPPHRAAARSDRDDPKRSAVIDAALARCKSNAEANA